MSSDLEEAVRLARQPIDSQGRQASDADRALALALIELVNVNRSQLTYLQRLDNRLSKPRRKFVFLRRKDK